MDSVTISAPGKLMLFGEHAVLYDHPCIVTAVGERMTATVTVLDKPAFELSAPDVNVNSHVKAMDALGSGEIPQGAAFVELAVKHFFDQYPSGKGIHIETRSGFSPRVGLGSSSASAVCVIKALADLFGMSLSPEQIFAVAYQAVLDAQGKGSGFDVAAAAFGGTLLFFTGGKQIEPLQLPSLPLIIGYTGVKADTVTVIDQVKARAEKFPKIIDRLYGEIDAVTTLALSALREGDLRTVGELMDVNHGYLSALGVSSAKLESLVHAARDAGAWGAKLSGAGGGDCMIALADAARRRDVEDAIVKAGGTVMRVEANAEGMRVE